MIRATGSELLNLLREAGAVRDARTGPVVTYPRKVFIPLTNLYRDRCGYCTFAREPSDGKVHTLTPDEVLAVAHAGRKADCKEAFSLGDKPELRYPEYRAWLEQRGFSSTIESYRPCAAWCLMKPACCRTLIPAFCDARKWNNCSRSTPA